MIMESMLTLKTVDHSRASMFLITTTENSKKTDDLLNRIYMDAVANFGPDPEALMSPTFAVGSARPNDITVINCG